MSITFQYIIVALIIIIAVIIVIRKIKRREDPCCGCKLSQSCQSKKKASNRETCNCDTKKSDR